MDVIYSSELVPPGLLAPPARDGETLTQRAREALAAHGLALRTVGANTFVVVRAPTPMPAVESEEPMDEISVYASRYAIDGGLAEPREVSPTDIERVPGSHDDALRALHSLPGIATNASARPYIRGSLSEDILVRYDGIGLLDPFHLKNFQSLISAIDPAGIERIEVFSGGFPVRYGTRSGGVIDIAAPSYQSGHEYRANAQPDFRRRLVDRQIRALAHRVARCDPRQHAGLARCRGRRLRQAGIQRHAGAAALGDGAGSVDRGLVAAGRPARAGRAGR